jgi:hypothetical protein
MKLLWGSLILWWSKLILGKNEFFSIEGKNELNVKWFIYV